jgi:hypothetical protein
MMTVPAIAQNAPPDNPVEVLKYATGKFCPSFFCGVSGYDISGLELSADGKTITALRADGTKGDTIAVSSLNPDIEEVLGMDALHFTGENAPNLQTTGVEARRLVTALNAIKNGTIVEQTAAPAPVPASTLSSVATTSVTPAATLTPATPAPPPSAATSTPKRIAIKVVGNCEKDPDPIGLASDDIYSDCTQEELDAFQKQVAASLSAKGIAIGDASSDFILTVTLTKLMCDTGVGGIIGDFASTWRAAASYQVVDSTGRVISNGTAEGEDSSDDDGVALQKLADSIASHFAPRPASGAQAAGN